MKRLWLLPLAAGLLAGCQQSLLPLGAKPVMGAGHITGVTSSPTPPQPPEIVQFAVSPQELPLGGNDTLTWTGKNVVSYSLAVTPSSGSVLSPTAIPSAQLKSQAASGSLQLGSATSAKAYLPWNPNALETVTFTLTGTGAPGTTPATKTLQITVPALTFKSLVPTLTVSRAGAVANTLPNGQVLISGGVTPSAADVIASTKTAPLSSTGPDSGGASLFPIFGEAILQSSELYSGSGFSAAANLQTLRDGAAEAPLPGGNLLVAGGISSFLLPVATPKLSPLDTAEIYAASSGAFSAISATLTEPRYGAVAAPLPGGDVLIAGGVSAATFGTTLSVAFLASAELFVPNAAGTGGSFQALSHSMQAARFNAVAAPLPGGDVLIAGGENQNGYLSSAELYDPSTQTFTATGSMAVPRSGAVAVTLENGEVLVMGGQSTSKVGLALDSAELYNPVTGSFSSIDATLPTATVNAAAALLADGNALIAGGQNYYPDFLQSQSELPAAQLSIFNLNQEAVP